MMTTPLPPYTQVPNALIELMAVMSCAEFKVCMAICRKTFGWHRPEATLSLADLERLTGMSRQTVVTGITHALERGILVRRVDGPSFRYTLLIPSTPQSDLEPLDDEDL